MVYDIDQLLHAYTKEWPPANGRLIHLEGTDGCDGYNPSQAVRYEGETYHYVRMEPRHDEFAYWSVPFRRLDGSRWEMEPALPMLHFQDPFVATVDGTLVVGGVSVLGKTNSHVFFETILLQGESPASLATFARSPLNMKDVRLLPLENGRIGIFTRPLGGDGGRGRIGYLEVDGLEQISAKGMQQARLFPTQPVENQWWGANDVHLLADGAIGVIGHIAKISDGGRHYYAVAFVFDPREHEIVDGPRIVADRSRFPPYAPKREDLVDVVFPASLDRERGELLCGVSDSAVGILEIGDPFADYERSR